MSRTNLLQVGGIKAEMEGFGKGISPSVPPAKGPRSRFEKIDKSIKLLQNGRVSEQYYSLTPLLFLGVSSILLQACTSITKVEVLRPFDIPGLANNSDIVVLAEKTNAIGHSKRSFFNLLPLHETREQKRLLTSEFHVIKSYKGSTTSPLLRLEDLDMGDDHWTPFTYCIIGFDLPSVRTKPKNLRFVFLGTNNLSEIIDLADEQMGEAARSLTQ